ncbi:rRNA pseudouridine synthase [Dolosigranulum pigrum]|uniref:pseudouridine synthase n=1 Tax=Dolosigranulum pigrum TaxID=29394 RepID=UPI001AD8946E|nr:pseudouridine synthase [Dolosigranulum pigrum]QTJ41763.1 rRNA pseudouridine synthase [Dolosigranulum pigrum]
MERLQKVMAHAGVASRRESENIISKGRVKVNGIVITEMGCKVGPDDRITVDGEPIEREEKVYILLNKDRQVISTVDDPQNRDTVIDSVEGIKERIYPVGRLDYDTTGALLLTNDGELANKLMHPRYEFEKTYVAKVNGRVTEEALQQLKTGVIIEGKETAPARVKLLSYDKKTDQSIVKLIIHEGRNHQVKLMMQAVGHPVKELTREKYGFLETTGLSLGQWRHLKDKEVAKLRKTVSS